MPVNATNDNLEMIAPSFKLINIDNTYVTLEESRGINGTVIVFICNHCPYVKAVADRLKKEADELSKYSINTIAIMSNDVNNYPEDSFENMKIFANKYKFNFPYLYDETQEIAKNYKAVCTPDFYGFDKDLKLKYRGRIDSKVMNADQTNNITRDLYNAMIKIMNDGDGPSEQINSIGCSIKWKLND